MRIRGSRELQDACAARLAEVLTRNGYDEIRFEYRTDGVPRYAAGFEFQGKEHEIEVYEDGPVMTSGGQLFESYLPEEFESEEALLDGFSERLDRYLAGGEWKGPREPGFLASLGLFFRGLLVRKQPPE